MWGVDGRRASKVLRKCWRCQEIVRCHSRRVEVTESATVFTCAVWEVMVNKEGKRVSQTFVGHESELENALKTYRVCLQHTTLQPWSLR